MRYLMILMLFVSGSCLAQSVDTIGVCTDKTVYVLFEKYVTMVELGSRDSYAYMIKENVVMLKALRPDAAPTSLFVKTGEGVFIWMIRFEKQIKKLLVNTMVKDPEKEELVETATPALPAAPGQVKGTVPAPPVLSKASVKRRNVMIDTRMRKGNRDAFLKDSLMEQRVDRMLSEGKNFRDLGEISNGIYFTCDDIYVDKQYLYIKMSLRNTSSIAFDLDFVYFAKNPGKSIKKREAYSTQDISFVYKESVFTVQPSAEETLVFVLELFAYHEKDKLLVKVNEKGGARSLKFLLPAKEILAAKSFHL